MRQITVIGRIGSDPQRRMSAKSGKSFFTFSVADNSRDKTIWFNVICYRFENVFDYLRTGRQVLVQGSFDVAVYKDNPDITVYCDQLELLGSRDNDSTSVTTPQDIIQSNEQSEKSYAPF